MSCRWFYRCKDREPAHRFSFRGGLLGNTWQEQWGPHGNGLSFHSQPSGADGTNNINTRAAGNRISACLLVESERYAPESHVMKYRVHIKIKICEDANLVWNPALDVETGVRLNPNSGVLFRCGDNRKRTTVSQDLRTVPSPESCSRVRAGSPGVFFALLGRVFTPRPTHLETAFKTVSDVRKKKKCNEGERRWRLHLPADVGQVSVAQNWQQNKIHNLSFIWAS